MSSSSSSTRASWLLAGALLLLAVAARGAAADADVADAADGRDLSRESMFTMASCIVDRAPVYCLERRATRYRVQLVGEQRAWEESRALRSADDYDDAGMRDAEELLDTVLPDDSKEQGPDRTSRGHKLKKKIHKLIKIIKIIVLIIVVTIKLVFLMFMAQTLFQAKLVGITFLILLIKKYYLYVEWKHKKEEKKAVVYYEHAQHQHHYDESDHYHDGLGGLLGHGQHDYKGVEPTAGAEAGAGWGGWWGKRSAEYPTAAVPAVAAPAVNPALAAQQMAYGAHLQGRPLYSG